jgi:hypothetical protein
MFFGGVPVVYFVFAALRVHVPTNGSAAKSGVADTSNANKHRSFRIKVPSWARTILLGTRQGNRLNGLRIGRLCFVFFNSTLIVCNCEWVVVCLFRETASAWFRLERAGEWWPVGTLGILRCAQDDGRTLQRQGESWGNNSTARRTMRLSVARSRRRVLKRRDYA